MLMHSIKLQYLQLSDLVIFKVLCSLYHSIVTVHLTTGPNYGTFLVHLLAAYALLGIKLFVVYGGCHTVATQDCCLLSLVNYTLLNSLPADLLNFFTLC